MKEKIIAIFKEPYSIEKSNFADNTSYLVSLRNQNFLRVDVKIHNEYFNSYEEQKEIVFRGGNINYDDLFWLTSESQWFKDLIFLPNINNLKLITLFAIFPKDIPTQGDDFIISKINPPISIILENVIVKYKWYISFSNQKDYERAFADNRSVLLNTLHLGLVSDTETSENILKKLTNRTNLQWRYDELLDVGMTNAYVVWIDSEFETFDPIYYIKNSYCNHFEKQIISKAKSNDCSIHILPKYNPIIWNWVHYGSLPVLR